MRTATRRLTWILPGLTAAAIGAAITSRWPDLLRRWRLHELRAAPSRFEEFLVSPDAAKVAAAMRFAWEPAGRRELFEVYIAEFQRTKYKSDQLHFLRRAGELGIASGILALGQTALVTESRSKDQKGYNHGSIGLEPEDAERRRRVLGSLDACCGFVFRTDRHPGFEFAIARITWEREQRPPWPPAEQASGRRDSVRWRDRSEGLEHICFFRRVE